MFKKMTVIAVLVYFALSLRCAFALECDPNQKKEFNKDFLDYVQEVADKTGLSFEQAHAKISFCHYKAMLKGLTDQERSGTEKEIEDYFGDDPERKRKDTRTVVVHNYRYFQGLYKKLKQPEKLKDRNFLENVVILEAMDGPVFLAGGDNFPRFLTLEQGTSDDWVWGYVSLSVALIDTSYLSLPLYTLEKFKNKDYIAALIRLDNAGFKEMWSFLPELSIENVSNTHYISFFEKLASSEIVKPGAHHAYYEKFWFKYLKLEQAVHPEYFEGFKKLYQNTQLQCDKCGPALLAMLDVQKGINAEYINNLIALDKWFEVKNFVSSMPVEKYSKEEYKDAIIYLLQNDIEVDGSLLDKLQIPGDDLDWLISLNTTYAKLIPVNKGLIHDCKSIPSYVVRKYNPDGRSDHQAVERHLDQVLNLFTVKK